MEQSQGGTFGARPKQHLQIEQLQVWGLAMASERTIIEETIACNVYIIINILNISLRGNTNVM